MAVQVSVISHTGVRLHHLWDAYTGPLFDHLIIHGGTRNMSATVYKELLGPAPSCNSFLVGIEKVLPRNDCERILLH